MVATEASDSRIPSVPFLRVLLGGLLGGAISNVSGIGLGALVLHAEANSVFQAMENPPTPTRMLVEHVLMRLGIGFAAAWLYRAIRPRYQRRTKAIAAAGTFLWVTTYLFSALILEELRIYSTRTAIIGAAWGFVELILVVATVDWILRDTENQHLRLGRSK
jgi:hypothetical protein